MRKAAGTEALERARRLRRDMTPAEEKLWSRLRGRRLDGFKFRRNEWVGPFIADFYCWKAKLIIEVDGSGHQQRKGYDSARDRWLQDRGLRVLRFWNNQVLAELDSVLEAIRAALLERVPSPSHRALRGGSLPLPERERER
jgi:very-short-patch-repair endonuclease